MAALDRLGQQPGQQENKQQQDARHAALRKQYQRPPMQSHTSNSVPSTPFQQPRDLRFSSRSPSPQAGLGNQSPRSVVSEVMGRTGSTRATGGVCRFESGAEIRKRRIPYVEGGNEELGPPKKEPKQALERDERDKLEGDMSELYNRLLPSDESEQRRARLVKKLERILRNEYVGSQIQVNVFGSSGNLLSSSESDVDICITTQLRLDMHALAELLNRNGMEKVVCRASAKVPIVKCWDPDLMLALDLNVNNTLALENTRMIKTYVQLDERVRPLAKIIKYWTNRRILNDAAFGGTISSYTWICMIISFLQRRDPPILPSLQKIKNKRKKLVRDHAGNGSEKAEESQFADDVDALKGFGDANTETMADLLFHFFRHYGYEFDFSKYVVSVKEGRLLSRKEKGWDPSNYADKEARNRLCVEEPFTTNRNLGNSADDYAWSGIHGEMRRAFDLLADGGQLESCCEQYEFPLEEMKSVFQRPAPKPKPTLTRSASQSGRSNHEQGSGRSRKNNNRNQSSQRSGNRRASSGASFSNQRIPLNFHSTGIGASVFDYFAQKGTLHDALAQQYQYLQAQQDLLQARLTQQQQQSRAQAQAGDLAGSPRQSSRAYLNGFPSPHYQLDNPPNQPPALLPGYLYHYPAKYPQPSPMSQARSREGSSTNPSSPSLVAAVPALRRQVHRGSIPDGTSGSVRSQSQPGRSLPHPLTLQQQVHPGYDVSGALGEQYQNVRASQNFAHGQPLSQMPYSPLTGMPVTGSSIDSPIPKEYVGYYVGQSPQLGPSQYAAVNQMHMPPMTLRDPPTQRPRRVTPDLMPPVLNGRHGSRSPSPLGHLRSHSTIGDLRSAQQQSHFMQSPTAHELQQQLPKPAIPLLPKPTDGDAGGPLIVNGSTPGQERPTKVNGPVVESLQTSYDDSIQNPNQTQLSRVHTFPMRSKPENISPQEYRDIPETPVAPKPKQGPRLSLSSPNGTSPVANGIPETVHETTPTQAPLLSPVVELRTPSPTHSFSIDRDSPQANGGFTRVTRITNAKQVERGNSGLGNPPVSPKHERKASAPNPTAYSAPKLPLSPTAPFSAGPTPPAPPVFDKNPWQQATSRRGHKKSKSTIVGRTPSGQGQPMPINESERKGG